MDTPFTILTGLIAGIIVTYGSQILHARRIDDVVDAIPVHGFCGAWGSWQQECSLLAISRKEEALQH
jgi:Amt family ammonium transporter